MKKLFGANSRAQVGDADEAGVCFVGQREEMVRNQIVNRGIVDERVLAAMRRVPRHEFVPLKTQGMAYEDRPLAIGFGQTISQPYIVAYMTAALRLPQQARVLDVGTGSAYQAAVLAEIAERVYSVEIIPELAAQAAALLERLGCVNVETAERDGSDGWLEHAPYDGILVAAAAGKIPDALLDQLKPGARLVMPVGGRQVQSLIVVTRGTEGCREESVMTVCFVPMTGRSVE